MSLVHLGEILDKKELSLRLLDDDHYIENFDCKRDEAMNAWLVRHARKWQAENLSMVWVLSPSHDCDEVIGFFTLSSHQVSPIDVPKRNRAQLKNNKPWVNNLDTAFPATLLGKFALDQSCQGRGVGETLMLCVYVQHLLAASHSASKFLVLDVRDPKLEKYYRDKFNFIKSPDGSGSSRMIKSTSTIEEEVKGILLGTS
ncbi:MAG: hypothetical protein Q4P06_05410 [Actinomycetaceae bacterium]|nr:hypothetical protein [Actinomycetaceae bacterium]